LFLIPSFDMPSGVTLNQIWKKQLNQP
jgi:hypothetical protein